MAKIAVKVTPRAHKDEVVGMQGEVLKVKLRAPPVDGAANEALIELLAEHFKVKKSVIRIVSGGTSRLKVIDVGSP